MNNLCVPQRFHPRTWTLNIGTDKNVFHELWIKIVKVLKILVVTVRRREAFTCIRDSGLRFFLEIKYFFRRISRIPAASRMELFATLVNGFQPLTKVTKNSILHVAGVLGKPLFFVIFILYLFYLCYLLLFYQIEV